jgi:photosystem II stability/assembly factor-like uncharacterized protein
MRKYILLTILTLVVITACQKLEELDITVIVEQVSANSLKDVFYLNDSVGFACGGTEDVEGQIFKLSSSTWSQVYTSSNSRVNSVYSSPSGKMFAGGDFVKLYTSADQGDSWNIDWLDSNELSYHEHDRVSIDKIEFLNDSVGFFVGGDRYEHGHIYTTNDNGNNWQFEILSHEITGISILAENKVLFSGYGCIGSSRVAGGDAVILHAPSDFLVGVHAISLYNYIAIGNSGSIYRSINRGDSWKKITKLRKANIIDTEFAQNKLYAVGSNGACFYSIDLGETWKSINLKTTAQINGISVADQYLNLAGSNGNIYRVFLADLD